MVEKNLASSHNLAERKALVNLEDERLSIKKQLSLLGVNRSSYYYRAAGPSELEIAVKHQIDRIFTRWPCFGYRRLTAFVIQGMQKALVSVKPGIINSDQGGQFTSQAYVDLMHSHSARISMDGKGRASDNVMTERFFRSLKYEKL